MKKSILSTAVPKPEIDFLQDIVKEKPAAGDTLLCIDDVILSSTSKAEFFDNVSVNFSKAAIDKIEEITRGQASNSFWFQHRKGVITASKAHEVKTKM